MGVKKFDQSNKQSISVENLNGMEAIEGSIAMSSTEAEHKAAIEALQEIIWLRELLKEIGYEQKQPTIIYEDNKSTMTLGENFSGKVKKVKHFLRSIQYMMEHVNELKTIMFEYLVTDEQIADVLTKPLGPSEFLRLRDWLLGHWHQQYNLSFVSQTKETNSRSSI